MAQFWKKEVELGKDIVVYDFDGPRLEGGKVTCEEVTPAFVREKIKDPTFPFGHGYIYGNVLSMVIVVLKIPYVECSMFF